jgi:hypothetical protein
MKIMTINYGSMLCVKIKSVKDKYDDLTMSLSCQVLSSMNADFDQPRHGRLYKKLYSENSFNCWDLLSYDKTISSQAS